MQPIVAPIALHDIGPQVASLIEALRFLVDKRVIAAQDVEEKTKVPGTRLGAYVSSRICVGMAARVSNC